MDAARRILVATASFGQYSDAPLHLLRNTGLEITVNHSGRTLTSEEVVTLADGCVGIVAGTERYTREALASLPRLRVISRCGAGLDTLDLEAARNLGIVVTSTPFGPTQAVAELTLGLILNLIRHVSALDASVKRGAWDKRMGFMLGEMTVGILGLGRIGRRLAEMLRLLGAAVVGCDIQPDPAWAETWRVTLLARDEVLRAGDVLCLHLPYADDLYHLIGRRELAMMKPGSYLVNTSRGGLVDEEALYEALASGHVRGAALDTFDREPYTGHLRDLDTVILTPHVGSYGRAGRVKMEQDSVENLVTELQRLAILDRGSG